MNPYHKFLDLSESETAPDHYGLLGVPRFTDDARVIHDALVSRNSQLKGWDNSKFYLEANALLDEVVAASFILEDPIKKAAYDVELRQRLGLPAGKPVAVVTRPEVVEGQPPTAPPTRRNESSLPERSARPTKQPETIRAERDDEPTDAETDAPETSFDSRFLKLGGALIAVTLLIAVPVVMWTGRKPEPGATPNQIVVTADTLETRRPVPEANSNLVNVRELATLAGHIGQVNSVVFSPDGKRLASACGDYTVKVWDAMTGPATLTLRGLEGYPFTSVAFSPDGKRLASANRDGTVKVWDATSGQELLTLKEQTHLITSVAFSPDGQRLAAGVDRTIKVWDAANGEELLAMKGHAGPIYSVAFSSDGKRLASASGDQTVKMWDATSGQELLTLKGHTRYVTSVAFSPDGTRLASASSDQSVKMWDATSGQETLTLSGHTSQVWSVAFSPDGKRLASANGDSDKPGEVKLWDATSGLELLTLTGHTLFVTSVAFSPDGKRLASAGTDTKVKIWDVDRTNAGSLNSPTAPTVTEIPKPAPDPDWDPTNVRELAALTGHAGIVFSAAFSPDGSRLASSSDDKTVKIWDATSGQELLTFKGHTHSVHCVTYSPDGKRLASAGDKTVRVWDATSGQELLLLTGHTSPVFSVAYSADGKRLVSASMDQTVRVWDATSGQETLTLKGHTDWIWSVAFSPDGKRLASAGRDQTVRVWDATSGEVLHTLKGHTAEVKSVAFSPDGKRLVSGSWDQTMKVWDATSGEELLTLKGQLTLVFGVALSADGKRLASASGGMVKVWDTTSGQEMLTLKGHANLVTGVNIVTSVAFSPDGKRVASTGYDHTVKIWGAGRDTAGSTTPATGPPNAPRLLTSKSTGMQLALIPAGTFLMGSPADEAARSTSEGPQHSVKISQPFYMGLHEVTQAEYVAVIGTNPSHFSKTGSGKSQVSGMETSQFPVEMVSWFDTLEFCNKLSVQDGLTPYYSLTNVTRNSGSINSATVEASRAASAPGLSGYRLPTEAEWEYACRANTTAPFHFGSTLNGDKANVDGNYPYGTTTKGKSLQRTTTVGSYGANEFGLFDMHGNLWEWCDDEYDERAYSNRSGTTTDPRVTSGSQSRVLRGGSWSNVSWLTRSTLRNRNTPGRRGSNYGFRVVLPFSAVRTP